MELAIRQVVGTSRKIKSVTADLPASLTQGASALALGISFIVLLGWWLDIPGFRTIFPGHAQMNPLTAVGFFLCGYALWARTHAGALRYVGILSCSVVVLVGALRLSDYFFATGFGVDRMLFRYAMMHGDIGSADMPLNTAISFALLGVAIGTLYTRGLSELRQATNAVTVFVAWLAILGYVFSAQPQYTIGRLIPMAIHTAVVFAVLAVGVYCAKPNEGIVGLLRSPSLGGIVARRTIPTAFVLPLAVGVFAVVGERLGLFVSAVGVAITMAVITLVIVLRSAALAERIDELDKDRLRAVRALQRSEQELKAANAVLKDLAALDPLTGLLNRRSFDSMLAQEAIRCREDNLPLSLIMLDLDNFKQYNDRYGHKRGDELLKAVAKLLRENARVGDGVARFGGDEFALILPLSRVEQAEHVAERMRRSLAASPELVHTGVTMSVGVATIDLEHDLNIVEAADACLYEAKKRGRNLVVSCSDREA